MAAAEVGGETSLPPPPSRRLDTVEFEDLVDLVDLDAPGRAFVKSHDFKEFDSLDLRKTDIQVVLFDAFSVDSFAACFAARQYLDGYARYEGVDRGMVVEDLSADVAGQVVAMLGVSWSLEAMHDLVAECKSILILETNRSVARELEQFNYPNAIVVLDLEMGAGALAWNFFFPERAVPPLLRALEDMELGRAALRDSAAFADGFETAFDFHPPRGEVSADDAVFEEFELLLDGGGRLTINRAIEEGLSLRPSIQEQCCTAATQSSLRTLRFFPAWRCILANVSSPFAGRIGEHLAMSIPADDEAGNTIHLRCFAAVYEVKHRHVRAVLRSLQGGPDVSEIAAMYDGCGQANRAFFTVAIDMWERLWVQPDTVLWNVEPTHTRCLALSRGERVTVARRGQRFRESPFDEWSWGYRTDSPTMEGWIPTLAHTLFVATRSVPSLATGILGLDVGDLLVARGQRGQYFWGWKCHPAEPFCEVGPKAWFPHMEGVLRPVHATSVQALLASGGA